MIMSYLTPVEAMSFLNEEATLLEVLASRPTSLPTATNVNPCSR
jgi:hypothetical protein